jgi:hypothetical protein
MSREVIHGGVEGFHLFHQEKLALLLPSRIKAWSFLCGEQAHLCAHYDISHNISHVRLEFPSYDADRHRFNLQDTFRNILSNGSGEVWNGVAFLHSTGLAKLI